jgi:hypothetical protein
MGLMGAANALLGGEGDQTPGSTLDFRAVIAQSKRLSPGKLARSGAREP